MAGAPWQGLKKAILLTPEWRKVGRRKRRGPGEVRENKNMEGGGAVEGRVTGCMTELRTEPPPRGGGHTGSSQLPLAMAKQRSWLRTGRHN